MSTRLLVSLISTSVVLSALIVIAVMYVRRLRKSHDTTWEGLMQQLVPVDRRAIETVALDVVEPSGALKSDDHQRELGRQDIWRLLGGMEGINRIESNSRVLIEIALYLQHWHPETADMAEELRLEAHKLEWHISRLRAAEKNQCLELHFHSYGQSAAVSYYRMLKQIIALYQCGEDSLLGDLQRAL
jgi:hypothetical protein